MNDPFARLKKTLFSLFLHYRDPQFFFIGAAIGRVTFRKFFQLVDEYHIDRNEALEFLALQLKIWNCRQLTDSDERLKHEDAFHALEFLKSYSEGPRLLAFIATLQKKNDDLKKWFAPLPDEVPRLTFYFAAELLQHGLKNFVFVPKTWARNYFSEHHGMTDDGFNNLVCTYAQLYTDSSNDTYLFDLCELAEFEQILLDETKTPASSEQREQFIKSLFSEKSEEKENDDECWKFLKMVHIVDPNLNRLSVTL